VITNGIFAYGDAATRHRARTSVTGSAGRRGLFPALVTGVCRDTACCEYCEQQLVTQCVDVLELGIGDGGVGGSR